MSRKILKTRSLSEAIRMLYRHYSSFTGGNRVATRAHAPSLSTVYESRKKPCLQGPALFSAGREVCFVGQTVKEDPSLAIFTCRVVIDVLLQHLDKL